MVTAPYLTYDRLSVGECHLRLGRRSLNLQFRPLFTSFTPRAGIAASVALDLSHSLEANPSRRITFPLQPSVRSNLSPAVRAACEPDRLPSRSDHRVVRPWRCRLSDASSASISARMASSRLGRLVAWRASDTSWASVSSRRRSGPLRSLGDACQRGVGSRIGDGGLEVAVVVLMVIAVSGCLSGLVEGCRRGR